MFGIKHNCTLSCLNGDFSFPIFLNFDHCHFISLRFLLAFIITVSLVACSGSGGVAPVYPIAPYSGPRPSYYTVRQGDTLYSISWRYGLDYRTLARWNRINPPYTIYTGQKLRLTSSLEKAAKDRATPLTPKPKQVVSHAVDHKEKGKDKETGKTKLAVSSPLTGAQPTLPKKTPQSTKPARIVQGIYWHWPTQGKVVQSFSRDTSDRKGIEIAGQLGQSVVAAASGKVVYSGMGLPRYGKLIIIKHGNHFLSAYAHNRLLLSKEGDQVKGGQKIAEMGHSGADQAELHFEIRHNGQPVDPLNYLPKQ